MSSFNLQELKQFEGIGTLIHQSTMSSTSDIARETLLNGSATSSFPMLVLCNQQTSGRGQPGKSWQSNRQSLTFTWCVPTESIPSPNQPLLSLIAGISVCEAINSLGISAARLKWPNDVLIDRQKVAGILVEKISSGNQACFLVGVGINVNQSANDIESLNDVAAAFPPGSLKVHLGSEIEMQTLLIAVINRLADNATLETQWEEHCGSRFDFLGEQITFTKAGGEQVSGIFKGVDSTGRIQIDVDGELQFFASGQLGPSRR